MLKILTIIGARPQIIKAAALSRAIQKHFFDSITECILHTGQHYDHNMSELFFEEMEIPKPYINLQIGSKNRQNQILAMQQGIEHEIDSIQPDVIVLYGDTNSTYAGAVAGANKSIHLVHIEAGLRSYNMEMPEEENRITADQNATLLFAPTQIAVENLYKEGIGVNTTEPSARLNQKVFHCGDVMYDNATYYSKDNTNFNKELEKFLNENYILSTVHRNYNTNNIKTLESIFTSFIEIVNQSGLHFVIPLHPRTQKILEYELPDFYKELEGQKQIHLIKPVSYLDMIQLLKYCKMVMTDSGGLQKESYFFKKPCVVLRTETEWIELVDNGNNILAHGSSAEITSAFQTLWSKKDFTFPDFYGDGKAAEFICNKIILHLS